mmetsp:Transcript_11311/g.31216  ORF Transcript_11311/g.31216 Transcript_11311/m.31216 type:complete len:216 (-) Transcript_11311:79-726(-)
MELTVSSARPCPFPSRDNLPPPISTSSRPCRWIDTLPPPCCARPCRLWHVASYWTPTRKPPWPPHCDFDSSSLSCGCRTNHPVTHSNSFHPEIPCCSSRWKMMTATTTTTRGKRENWAAGQICRHHCRIPKRRHCPRRGPCPTRVATPCVWRPCTPCGPVLLVPTHLPWLVVRGFPIREPQCRKQCPSMMTIEVDGIIRTSSWRHYCLFCCCCCW